MTPDANQAQLLSIFIATISSGQNPVLQPTFRYTTMFLNEVATIAANSHVLEWAVRAVSLSHLGRQVQDQHLIQLSRQMYRQALLTLNAALQDPIDGLSSKTLAATILLSFYEVINCTENNSWVRHAGGAGHLMRLRGPERHRTCLGRSCFLAYRHSLVIEAFLSRNATFLAAKPWLDLSRDIQASLPDRTPISDLVDDFHLLIVELPGFTQSVQDTNATTASKRKLLASGTAHRENMNALYKRITTTLKDTGAEISSRPASTNDPVFPTVYAFPSLAVGSLLCGYWTTLTVLNRNLALLENDIVRPSEVSTADVRAAPQRYHLRNSPGDGGKYLEENLKNARESCRAAEYLSCSAFLGPLYLIFALRVAWNTFPEGKERDWVLAKLEEVSAHLGIARALLDVQVQREKEKEKESLSASSSSASLSRSVSVQGRVGASVVTRSPDLNRSADGQPEASQKGSAQDVRREGVQNLSQGDDLSRRTSVSLQEIERRPSRQEEVSESSKAKGVLR
jgi:Fungal specific transcription factor domain